MLHKASQNQPDTENDEERTLWKKIGHDHNLLQIICLMS